MSSGWEVYYVVFLSALIALGFPLLLVLVARSRSKNLPLASAAGSNESPQNLSEKKINTRYYLAVNVSSLLIGMTLILLPAVSAVYEFQKTESSQLLLSLAAVISIAIFLSLGLLYSSKKGDLGWNEQARPYSGKKELK